MFALQHPASVRGVACARCTRDAVKPGDAVSVAAHPFKSGQKGGGMMSVTLPDGRVLVGGEEAVQQTVALPPDDPSAPAR